MKSVSANAIFCEDLRREASGRDIIIGTFADTLRLKTIPGAIRRMVVYVRIRIEADVDLGKPIKLSLVGTNGEDVRGNSGDPIPVDVLQRGVKATQNRRLPYYTIVGQIRVAEPAPIQQEGLLSVYIHYGDEKEMCGYLNVVLHPDATASQQPAS